MRYTLPLLLLILLGPAEGKDMSLSLTDYDNKGLTDWQRKSFSGDTEYSVIKLEGRRVLQARSRMAASALYKEITVDLEETPYLNWSWRIDNVIEGFDERTKSGDDFAARIYVVVKDGIFPWQAKALNYVWSSSSGQGASWPNPYAPNDIMIALRSGDRESGAWKPEKVNIARDLQRMFGKKIRYVHGVAIMTDTDNTGTSATAYYGDIHFTKM